MRSLLLAALCLASCHATHADEPDPPVAMTQVDAARLDAALTHLREIAAQAQAQSAPYAKQATEILSRYKIDPRAFGKGVTVDFATGKIERKPQAKPR